MQKYIFYMMILLVSAQASNSQEVEQYFPTGMSWKEVTTEPDALSLDTLNARLYEIGGDTLIGAMKYKMIYKNGDKQPLCVREAEQQVWLLTEEYPQEIKLYDFRWDDTQSLCTEYLQETSEGVELSRCEFKSADVSTVRMGQYYYQYLMDAEGVTLRGLGRISELNKNGSILGYKRPYMIIPGIIYNKVLWIKRDGVEVFRSEKADEWTSRIPSSVETISAKTATSTDFLFDLSGRRLSAPPARGLYIEDGRKRVAGKR